MGVPKLFHVAISFVILVFFVDVAEGHFLDTLHTRLEAGISTDERANNNEKPPMYERMINLPEMTAREKMAKYPVIEFCHLRLEKVFGKYHDSPWHDWKLWIGLTCWLAVWAKWLLHGPDETYLLWALFAFAINILILHHLQYSPTIQIGMIGVCAVLAAQALLQSYVTFNSEPRDESSEFDCDTLYLDLALPMEQIIILFVAQFGVWWFYMTSILGNFDFAHVNYLFWVWAYLVMQMTMIFCRGGDSVLGNAFPVHDVKWLVLNANGVRFALLDENGEKGEEFTLSKANIIMRGVTGFFCNCILREIMAYTIPLMLMGFSEPMDFVVYCVGVNFICTLDDMHERKYLMKAMTARSAASEALPATSDDPAGQARGAGEKEAVREVSDVSQAGSVSV